MQAPLHIEHDRIRIGEHLWVSLQRTLRVPDDGREYPLPVSLGRLPVVPVDAFPAAPANWRGHGALLVPMYQREALWLGFDGPSWRPTALKVGLGGINAVSGQAWTEGLDGESQDYLVCPPQLWLDGVNAGPAQVRQFVAMPLGSGTTVEGQLTGRERIGAMQLHVHEPLPGRFADAAPPDEGPHRLSLPQAATAMGLAPGGRIKQRIYRDPYGVTVWQPRPSASLTIHIANSLQYERITGRPPPPTPIDARSYQERGLPWLVLFDETMAAIPAAARLADLEAVGAEGLPPGAAEPSIDVAPERIRRLGILGPEGGDPAATDQPCRN